MRNASLVFGVAIILTLVLPLSDWVKEIVWLNSIWPYWMPATSVAFCLALIPSAILLHLEGIWPRTGNLGFWGKALFVACLAHVAVLTDYIYTPFFWGMERNVPNAATVVIIVNLLRIVVPACVIASLTCALLRIESKNPPRILGDDAP